MSSPNPHLQFYLSNNHPCGYLPEQLSVSLIADPHYPINTQIYTRLVEIGFRRSGRMAYRPHCPECQACVPVRIDSQRFQFNRQQRRNLKRNADLEVVRTPMRFDTEHYALYSRYITARHSGGSMEESGPEGYSTFLTQSCCETQLVEFRQAGRLVMVAVVDYLNGALSAVYSFFDPEEGARSLGRYAILWQLKECQRLNLPHLYLGYWIADCRKMVYKREYRPIEQYRDGLWRAMSDAELGLDAG